MDDVDIEIGQGALIDLEHDVIALHQPSGVCRLMKRGEPGPPVRIEGYTIGAPFLTEDAPHDGEMHPDADEVLFLVSGRIDVDLELEPETITVSVGPGDALVVPKGIWHRVRLVEPGQLVHITPGPHGDHRPLPNTR